MKPTLILALSGGPDSVYLLHKLLKQDRRPILAHLNHRLRGKDSNGDERFVRQLGKKYGLKVEVERHDVAAYAKRHKLSIETAARQLRYAFLEKIRQKYQASTPRKKAIILTAHTLDDNLETVIMNELRRSKNSRSKGANPFRGQIGMRKKCGFIQRPLLDICKKTILAHLRRQRLPYRTDASNYDLSYRRNWIRHVLIPRFTDKNPHLYKEFAAARKKALRTYEKHTQTAEDWLKKNGEHTPPKIPIAFSLAPFKKLSNDRQMFLLQHLYEKTYGSTVGLTTAQLEEVHRLLIAAKTGKQKKFGPHFTMWIKRGNAELKPSEFSAQKSRK